MIEEKDAYVPSTTQLIWPVISHAWRQSRQLALVSWIFLGFRFVSFKYARLTCCKKQNTHFVLNNVNIMV